jgi:hypothetical protein
MFKLDYTSTQNHSAVVDVTLAPGHMSVGELKHTVFRPFAYEVFRPIDSTGAVQSYQGCAIAWLSCKRSTTIVRLGFDFDFAADQYRPALKHKK